MRACWKRLYAEESGMVLSAELIIISTVLVLGLVTGLACVQAALVGELTDLSHGFRSLNQSYGFTGYRGCRKWWGRTSWTAGSTFIDSRLAVRTDGDIGAGIAVPQSNVPHYGAPATPTPAPQDAPLHAPISPVPQAAPCEGCEATPCDDCETGGLLPIDAEPVIPAGPIPQFVPEHVNR